MTYSKEEVMKGIHDLPEFEIAPVFLEGPQNIPNFVAVKEKERPVVVGMMSPKYRLVQFKEVFMPAIEQLGDFKGVVWYWRGKAVLGVYPEGEEFQLNEEDKIGLVLKNSMDGSCSVMVNFSLLHEGVFMGSLPVKGIKRMHVGDPLTYTQDFLNVIGKVKEHWKQVVKTFEETKVDAEVVKSLCKHIKLGKKVEKELLLSLTPQSNLWTSFLTIIETAGKKHYRSEVHKAERIERIAGEIQEWVKINAI